MDAEPDILSFEPRRRGGRRPGRGGWIAIFALGVLLGGVGAGTYLAVLVGHRDGTIGDLQAALRKAGQPAPAAVEPALPVDSGSALSTFPDGAGGSFSMVTAAVRPRPGAAALTWLFIYGQHADPGARYGVLEGTCGGQFVTSSDLADGTANSAGDLTIVAPNLDISPAAGDVWVLVYRLQDGVTLGGIQGPLIGGGAKAFHSVPRCLGTTYPGTFGFVGVYGPPGGLTG
jgi:hypothetical protein